MPLLDGPPLVLCGETSFITKKARSILLLCSREHPPKLRVQVPPCLPASPPPSLTLPRPLSSLHPKDSQLFGVHSQWLPGPKPCRPSPAPYSSLQQIASDNAVIQFTKTTPHIMCSAKKGRANLAGEAAIKALPNRLFIGGMGNVCLNRTQPGVKSNTAPGLGGPRATHNAVIRN